MIATYGNNCIIIKNSYVEDDQIAEHDEHTLSESWTEMQCCLISDLTLSLWMQKSCLEFVETFFIVQSKKLMETFVYKEIDLMAGHGTPISQRQVWWIGILQILVHISVS